MTTASPARGSARTDNHPASLDRLLQIRAALEELTGDLATVRRRLREAEAELEALKKPKATR